MKSKPLVSIIVPNYNHARFLDERLQSILNQTYQNFELIILDDKSDDNSLEIINRYKDNSHVSQIFINEENSGSVFLQWEKGMMSAKGDLIWIAESDDFAESSQLESLVSLFDDNKVILAFCRSQLINEKSEVFFTNNQSDLHGSFIMDSHLFIKCHLQRRNVIENASSVIFRKEAAIKVRNRYRELKGAGDWLFWIGLCQNEGKVAFIEEALNYYRKHVHSQTSLMDKTGGNIREGKYIYDYLLSNQLISEEDYQENRFNQLRFIKNNIKDKQLRYELINLWQGGIKFYIKDILLRICHRLS